MKSVRIIFLDIDGVLNGYSKMTGKLYWLFTHFHLMEFVNKYYDLFGIRTHNVRLLSKIIRCTGAKVVLSSSWRSGWFVSYEEKSKRHRRLQDLFAKFNIDVVGITPFINGRREAEIARWISENHCQVENFVVIDDEKFGIEEYYKNHFVQTSETDEICGSWYENTGLKRKHVLRAIEILNKT